MHLGFRLKSRSLTTTDPHGFDLNLSGALRMQLWFLWSDLGLRFGQGLSWQHFWTIGGMKDERGHNGRGLHQIARLDALINIHVRVMRSSFVFHGVLNELKTRQPDRVEGKMISAPSAANGKRRGAHVPEGLEPKSEDGSDHVVVLKVNTANLACPIVEIEVGSFSLSGCFSKAQ